MSAEQATGEQSMDWESIVDQHSDRVFRLAMRLTGNRHDAEDLTQEVFVRVFRSLHTYQPGTFEGWLHRITTNLFLDQARRRQRIRFEALSDERAARIASAVAGPDMAYDARTRADLHDRAGVEHGGQEPQRGTGSGAHRDGADLLRTGPRGDEYVVLDDVGLGEGPAGRTDRIERRGSHGSTVSVNGPGSAEPGRAIGPEQRDRDVR